jgi:branched-chain amino acid transport system ATP-binding protein
MNTATILEINGITKRFGGLVAVDNLHFNVNELEVIGLIGPNGSGKTTVMNLISGALNLTSGEIRMGDTIISNLPPHRIAQNGIARTFQLVKILPTMSVLDNVIAGGVFGHRKMWGEKATKKAYQLLERVGLVEQADNQTEELTYIDQKRLGLARALAGDPKLLLLDEWLAGLNPTELQVGIDLINSLRNEGRTIILVEHVMDAIRSICDRCIVMNSGIKIAEGQVETTLKDPEVIRAYLGDSED